VLHRRINVRVLVVVALVLLPALAQAELPNANLPGNSPSLPNSNMPGNVPNPANNPVVLPNTDTDNQTLATAAAINQAYAAQQQQSTDTFLSRYEARVALMQSNEARRAAEAAKQSAEQAADDSAATRQAVDQLQQSIDKQQQMLQSLQAPQQSLPQPAESVQP
jgi:hypothetical protein